MGTIKEKLSGRNLTKNIGLKILSLLFAIVVWLIVVNISDPVTTKTFREVPVTIEHTEFLTDEGMVYEVLDGSDVVDITVSAKRSVLSDIKKKDFVVKADMRELLYMQTIQIVVSLGELDEKVEDWSCSHDTVLIEVEEQNEKTLQVELETEGTLPEGYTIGKYKLEPSEVRISGPKSIVKKVDKAVLRINVEAARNDVAAALTPILYDAQGETIETDRLNFSNPVWNVVVPVWETKSVAVQAAVTGEPAEGYNVGDITCYPTALTVTGKKEILEKLSEIEIPEGVLDVEGATGNVVVNVDIEQYLPEGIYLVDEDMSAIKIEADVEKQITRNYAIGVDEIGLRNQPEDLKVSFAEVTQFVVELRGTKEELDGLQVSDIKCTANLSGLSAGQHQVALEIVVSGGAEVIGQHTITLYLEQKATGNETQNTTQNTTQNVN